MKQILVINGGTTYPSYEEYFKGLQNLELKYERLLAHQDWKPTLSALFPDDDILLPNFPNRQNAQYNEWCIYFEKLLPFLRDDFILTGHSLGAIFLAKYLHEHQLEKKAKKLILVAAPYDDEEDESLGGFKLTSATGLENSASEVHLFFSKDDPVVNISEYPKFQRDLPGATFHILDGYGHFNKPEFPELIELLK